MDKAWIRIIKITGSVGVVGLLFSLLMSYLFNNQIIDILGSEKLFFILVLIVCCLFVALIFAIKTPQSVLPSNENKGQSEPSKKIDITYNRSTHNGDNKF